CRPMAEVMGRLGAEHVMVVHGQDGLDEISLAGRTHVAEFHDGKLREFSLTPEDVGVASASLVGLDVTDPNASLALIRDAFGKRESPRAVKAAAMITLNAGAAIHVAGVADTLEEGVRIAEEMVKGGQALDRMQELARFTSAL